MPRKAGVPLTSAVATVYYCTLYHYSDPVDKPGSLEAVQKVGHGSGPLLRGGLSNKGAHHDFTFPFVSCCRWSS